VTILCVVAPPFTQLKERHAFFFVVEFFQEFLFVHLHFIICGAAMVTTVIFILVQLRQLYAARDFITQMRRNEVHHRELDSRTKREEKGFNQKKRDRYCRMVGLAFACTVLLLFNVVWSSTSHTLPTSPINHSFSAFVQRFLRDLLMYFSQQISKASTVGRYDEIARRANIYSECQQFDTVCDLEHDMGKEVDLILAKCRHAEDEVIPHTPYPILSQNASSSHNSHNINHYPRHYRHM
jgi:hypothetical protein